MPWNAFVIRVFLNQPDPSLPAQVRDILDFVETDTVLFYGEEPPELLELQTREWSPIIRWFRYIVTPCQCHVDVTRHYTLDTRH